MDIKTKLDVLFVSAECIPFCANGGVADMCYALPKYLNKTDKVNVRVILPLYSKIPEKYRNGFRLFNSNRFRHDYSTNFMVERVFKKGFRAVYSST